MFTIQINYRRCSSHRMLYAVLAHEPVLNCSLSHQKNIIAVVYMNHILNSWQEINQLSSTDKRCYCYREHRCHKAYHTCNVIP